MFIAALMAAALAAPPQEAPQDVADATVAPATVSAEGETAEDDDKPICITHAQLGTRFKKKTCYTRIEYERRQLEERQTLQRIQRIPLRGE